MWLASGTGFFEEVSGRMGWPSIVKFILLLVLVKLMIGRLVLVGCLKDVKVTVLSVTVCGRMKFPRVGSFFKLSAIYPEVF